MIADLHIFRPLDGVHENALWASVPICGCGINAESIR